MQGVTILNEFQAVIDTAFGWNAAGIAFLILFIVSIIAWICFSIIEEGGYMIITMVLALVTLTGFLATTVDSVPIYETQYQVLIDDTCDTTEFLNRYEIVERQGEIYVVRECNEE